MPSLKYCTCTILTATRHQIMVTINEMNEWIVCADTTRSGGHASLPLRFMKYFFNSPMNSMPRMSELREPKVR